MAQQPVKFYARTLSDSARAEIVRRACHDYVAPESDIEFVDIRPGYGRHIHDSKCGYVESDRLSCMKDCEDSDVIVEIQYSAAGYRAVYGVVDNVPRLWLD